MTDIYFAGAEVETLSRALMDNGVKNVLYSYFYILTMRREKFISELQAANPGVNWFLDSGAFTYAVKYRTESHLLPPYQTYVQRYFEYIDQYGDPFCRITEPDIDGIRGFEEVNEKTVDGWREFMLERWPHLNVNPVWHGWRGPEAWSKYVADPRIKALAIGRACGLPGLQRRMVLEAHKRGKPVHGFAQTKLNTTLKIVPYDTVDSTSWLMGQKFGSIYIFRNNKFIVLSKENGGKEKRKLFRQYFKNIGCDPQKVLDDDVAEVRKANVLAWRFVAERLSRQRREKGHQFQVDDTTGEWRDIGKPAARPRIAEMFAPRPKEREDGSEQPRARQRTSPLDFALTRASLRDGEPEGERAKQRGEGDFVVPPVPRQR